MAPVRLLTHRQFEILVEFAETNRDAALSLNSGRSGGPLGHQEVNKAWQELANRLNSLGEGLIKSPDKWKRYWHLLKCRVKSKAANHRRSQNATGGVPSRSVPLTDLENRIVAVIGGVSVLARTPRVRNEDRNVPRWVFKLGERRIAEQARTADAISALTATIAPMVQCMQQMAASQAQLVELLQRLQPPPP